MSVRQESSLPECIHVVTGTITSLGQHIVTPYGAKYSWIEFQDDSGRPTIASHVFIANGPLLVISVGSPGEFFIEKTSRRQCASSAACRNCTA